MAVERGAEAVQEGDAAEPRAESIRRLGIMWDTGGREQESLDLSKKDLREGRDGRGPIGEHAAQSLRPGDHPLPHGHRRDDVSGVSGNRLRTPRPLSPRLTSRTSSRQPLQTRH